MSTTMTIEVPVSFQQTGRGGRKAMRSGAAKPALPPGRVPRVSRLMALALRLDELVRTGQVASYSALAALGQVTRARISQIASLLHLAPDIQEAILFPRNAPGASVDLTRDLEGYPWLAENNLPLPPRTWTAHAGLLGTTAFTTYTPSTR